jgi:hypothetical protein
MHRRDAILRTPVRFAVDGAGGLLPGRIDPGASIPAHRSGLSLRGWSTADPALVRR